MSRRSKKCAEAAVAATVVMLGSEASRGSGGSDTPLHLYENGFTGWLRWTRFAFFTEPERGESQMQNPSCRVQKNFRVESG